MILRGLLDALLRLWDESTPTCAPAQLQHVSSATSKTLSEGFKNLNKSNTKVMKKLLGYWHQSGRFNGSRNECIEIETDMVDTEYLGQLVRPGANPPNWKSAAPNLTPAAFNRAIHTSSPNHDTRGLHAY